jgi:uncharacterized integral membrane protein (TIGR00697 family)
MNRKNVVFIVLGGFFLTNAILGELIGSKLIYVGPSTLKIGPLGPFEMSVGIVPWPVVFLATDLINEYFGRRGVRRLTFLTVGMIAYAYLVLILVLRIPASPSGIDGKAFNAVFNQSKYIIVGSMIAFVISQLVDVMIFHLFRKRTGHALLWLRSTGSTVFSQMVDSIVVLYIGLALPYGWSAQKFASVAVTNYSVKLLVAVLVTPLIYLGHWLIELYLGKTLAEAMAEEAAIASGSAVAPSHHAASAVGSR